MSSNPTNGNRCLVIESDPTCDPRRLGEWLTGAGLELALIRVHEGAVVPADLDGFAAMVVLGGGQHAYPAPDGSPAEPWFPAVESVLRKATRAGLPTLGVCLGAQLLATAHAGTVAPAAAGPEIGVRLVAKRDAAEHDPLFGPLPLLPDVIQWHFDEVTELPRRAVLLAASTEYPHQAFRIGERAWGIQFHIEADTDMIAGWASHNRELLAHIGTTAEDLVADVDAVMDDIFEAWQPFAFRFARLALGELGGAPRPGRELPVLRQSVL